MKKKIFTLLLLLVGVIGAYADNTLAVSSTVVTQGKDSRFSIELINSDELTAMQFDLTLPEGITVKEVEGSNRLHKTHSIGKSTVGESTRITLFSSENELITGESGTTIFTIVVTVDGSVALGEIAGKISNMELTKKDQTQFNPEAVDFTIQVTDKVIIDENSTLLPVKATGVNVLVNRTLTKDVWNTICLPFTMTKDQAEAAFGSDAKIVSFTGWEPTIDEETLIPSAIKLSFSTYTMNALKKFKAGNLYMVKPSQTIESFSVNGVNIVKDITPTTKADEAYGLNATFTGSLVKTTVPNKALFLNGNKFYYSNGSTVTKGMRGWFALDAVLDEAVEVGSRVFIVIDDNGETTKIEALRENTDDGDYYNLNGMKVVYPTVKGVYIKNGKKVVVK